MQKIKELLVGYCDPVQQSISERPIGETGLTIRVRAIAISLHTSQSLCRKHLWELAQNQCPELFTVLLGSVEVSWLTELLRVLDRSYTIVRGQPVPNLTVSLCHEEFQSEASVLLQDKMREQSLFAAVMSAYDAAALRECRNQLMFHLDLAQNLLAPTSTGNVHAVTEALLEWYKHVGTVVFGAEPFFVTRGGKQVGKQIAKQFRQLLLDRMRYQKRRRRKV